MTGAEFLRKNLAPWVKVNLVEINPKWTSSDMEENEQVLIL